MAGADPHIRQHASNAIANGEDHECRASLTEESKPKSTLVLIALAGERECHLHAPWGFDRILHEEQDEIQLYVWVYEAAPPMTSAEVEIHDHDSSLQVHLIEYQGLSQEAVVDRVTVRDRESREPYSGWTGWTSEPDELALGIIANRYASTTQDSFSGGMAKISETVSPRRYYEWWDHDWEYDQDSNRTRMTLHQAVTNEIDSFQLAGRLSSWRDWICVVITFRSGITGPVRMTSTGGTALTVAKVQATLTTYGPFQSKENRQGLTVSKVRARLAPFDGQYRIGGWTGLLLGPSGRFTVRKVEGLEGWTVRTSDADLPREAGAQRGTDLQSARRVLFEVNIPGYTRHEIESSIRELYGFLVPHRDTDTDLLWRHHGQGVRLMRCRPIDLERVLNLKSVFGGPQPFELRAANPRHYSAVERRVTVPASPSPDLLEAITAPNDGTDFAYPMIRIAGPDAGAISRVELVCVETDTAFDIRATLESGSLLVGDMEAQVTAAPRSVVTIDGQSKYGAWQQPRETFALAPGANGVYLQTEPAGANVAAELIYRDTWPG